MNSADRRMKLLLMLQSGKRNLMVDRLAQQFGVSRRTIFRDLRMIQNMEVPVDFDPEKGYSIPKGFQVPPLMFTTKQLATVMMGLAFVRSQADPGMGKDAAEVESKIRSVIPPDLRDWMNGLEKHTVVNPYSINRIQAPVGGDWYLIAAAMVAKDVIRFAYPKRRADDPDHREVSPYLMEYVNDHWTLIGYDHLRSGIRSFVVDRMAGVETTYAVYKPYKGQVDELIFRDEADMKSVVFRVNDRVLPDFLNRLPARVESRVPHEDGSSDVHFQFGNLRYLSEWALQFGTNAKPLSPNQLLLIREALLKEMAD